MVISLRKLLGSGPNLFLSLLLSEICLLVAYSLAWCRFQQVWCRRNFTCFQVVKLSFYWVILAKHVHSVSLLFLKVVGDHSWTFGNFIFDLGIFIGGILVNLFFVLILLHFWWNLFSYLLSSGCNVDSEL